MRRKLLTIQLKILKANYYGWPWMSDTQ